MDNSLIPRAFSPTDAKREREANAREAERQTSARTQSSGSIPVGGSLELGGDINIAAGGDINVGVGGSVNIAGRLEYPDTAAGIKDVTTTIGTQTYTANTQTYSTPGIFQADPNTGNKYSLTFSGRRLAMKAAAAADAYYTTVDLGTISASMEYRDANKWRGVSADGDSAALYHGSQSPQGVQTAAVVSLGLSPVPAYAYTPENQATIGYYSPSSSLRAIYRADFIGGHWMETSNAAGTVKTSVGTPGDGKLTIQATNGVDVVGKSTINGVPAGGTKWKSVPGAASGTLTPATGWISLGPDTTIPANPLGAGVDYRVKVTVQGCATPVSGGTFAVRALFNGATGSGGLSQAPYSSGNFTTLAVGESWFPAANSVTISAQIIALVQNASISSGAAISYYSIEVSPYSAL